MVSLLKKIQVQGPCSHRSQQSLSICLYKEFELLTGLFSLKMFLLPFSNRLLLWEN